MPIKYLCDICGAEAKNPSKSRVTTIMSEDNRLLVFDLKATWKHKDFVYDHDVLQYPAYICNHCVKEAIDKERV